MVKSGIYPPEFCQAVVREHQEMLQYVKASCIYTLMPEPGASYILLRL